MKDWKMLLLEKKMTYQEDYAIALEQNNTTRASFLRGKIMVLDELLKWLENEEDG